MQVGLDYQNFNSAKAQNVFGNTFTLPKIEESTKTKPAQKQEAVQLNKEEKVDEFNNSKENLQPTENKDITTKKPKTIKEKIAGVWKFFATTDQMASAGIRGVIYGALTGIALLTGSWIFKSLPNSFTKEGPSLWNTIRHPLKNIGKSGKIIAGIGAAIVLGVNLIKGKLDANQRTAVIDHKIKTGHRNA